jgi:hypothetical protein
MFANQLKVPKCLIIIFNTQKRHFFSLCVDYIYPLLTLVGRGKNKEFGVQESSVEE